MYWNIGMDGGPCTCEFPPCDNNNGNIANYITRSDILAYPRDVILKISLCDILHNNKYVFAMLAWMVHILQAISHSAALVRSAILHYTIQCIFTTTDCILQSTGVYN